MSNKPKHSKTNITKISAKPAEAKPTKDESVDPQAIDTKPTNVESTNARTPETKLIKSKADKKQKKSRKTDKNAVEKPLKEVFLLVRPFVAFGRYLRDSWREIRQVRWPNRKATWKMTFAVFIYCAIFMVFILVLDALFTFIFDLLLGIN